MNEDLKSTLLHALKFYGINFIFIFSGITFLTIISTSLMDIYFVENMVLPYVTMIFVNMSTYFRALWYVFIPGLLVGFIIPSLGWGYLVSKGDAKKSKYAYIGLGVVLTLFLILTMAAVIVPSFALF